MYILRSIDPRFGFMRDFKLEVDELVLIGKLPLEIILNYPDQFLRHAPGQEVEYLSDYIRSTKRLITPEECKIHSDSISRVHCMIFPGDDAKILDLFSTNRTAIASLGGGMILDPGRKTDLRPGDIILLAKGTAIFQYLGPDNGIEDKERKRMAIDRPVDRDMNQENWMRTEDEAKNIIRDIYVTFCGKENLQEIDISLDPVLPKYIVTHKKKGTHVKIPARLFPKDPNNLQIASIRSLLHRLG